MEAFKHAVLPLKNCLSDAHNKNAIKNEEANFLHILRDFSHRGKKLLNPSCYNKVIYTSLWEHSETILLFLIIRDLLHINQKPSFPSLNMR